MSCFEGGKLLRLIRGQCLLATAACWRAFLERCIAAVFIFWFLFVLDGLTLGYTRYPF